MYIMYRSVGKRPEGANCGSMGDDTGKSFRSRWRQDQVLLTFDRHKRALAHADAAAAAAHMMDCGLRSSLSSPSARMSNQEADGGARLPRPLCASWPAGRRRKIAAQLLQGELPGGLQGGGGSASPLCAPRPTGKTDWGPAAYLLKQHGWLNHQGHIRAEPAELDAPQQVD